MPLISVAQSVFWTCLLLILYTYLLYPVVLFLAYAASQVRRDWRYLMHGRDRRHSHLPPQALPAVSVVIPAFNEERRLPAKIDNLQALDYPEEKLEVIFVSDGSTDRTNEILSSVGDPRVRLVVLPVRQGKPTALNHAVSEARHDVLVFCDAATLFAPDAIKHLVRHLSDPRVGVVCGAVRLQGTSEFEQTEGVYWQYESMLRLMEARLEATVTASGALYAIRRACYRPLPADVLIDDFMVPMTARKLGYRVRFDPEAVATEFAADSVQDEFTRRVRLAVGSFRALREFVRVPLPPFTFLALFSHKVLRWILPFLMIGLFISNVWLWRSPFYQGALVVQLMFYLWAAVGFVFRHRLQRVRFGLIAYFLFTMNLAFLVGFARFLGGRDKATWQRVS
jgi:cellulose synthase/poly-beta-1,6-N-acetylglucosamine synthase-like glycosyltransferase